jgi:hypothetical protein
MDGITVSARNTATGQVSTTTAGQSGGYDLALAPGTYEVTFSGGGIATTKKPVTIGSQNVKVDLVDPALGTAPSTDVTPAAMPAQTTATPPASTHTMPEPTSTSHTSPSPPLFQKEIASITPTKLTDLFHKTAALGGTNAAVDSADQASAAADDTFHFRPGVAADGPLDDIAAPEGGMASDIAANLPKWSLDPALSHALDDLNHPGAGSLSHGADPHHDDAAAALTKLALAFGHHADL